MRRLRNAALAVAALTLLACLAQPASAAPVTLMDLITNGGTIQSGDKTFSNFMYSSTGSMPSASLVNVIPISQGGAFGIRFQGGFNGAIPASDALITFTVTSGGADITGAIMQGNPAVAGQPAIGAVTVTETFLPELTNTTLGIFDVEPGHSLKTTDSVTFAKSVHSLNVQKDIFALAGEGSTATISLIDQLFPQGRQSVPEPASLMLVGIGSLGLLGYKRLRAR
jgi:hypothetical protein